MAQKDKVYLTLRKGEAHTFTFNVPEVYAGRKTVNVTAITTGFYTPDLIIDP